MISRIRAALLIAMLIALPATAAAAEPEFDFAAMAAQCRSDGSGPWAFGEDLSAAPIGTKTGAGPFAKALARTTTWSDRVVSVELTVPLADEAAGKAREQALIAALEAVGWARVEDPTIIEFGLRLIESNYVLMPIGIDDPAVAPVFAGVSWYPSELRLTCTSVEWTRRDLAEMDGKLPHGSPRPAPPPLITAERPTKENCADPAYLANIEALFAKDARDAWVDQSAQQSRQAQRTETWIRWKLLSSGKVSEDEIWAIEDRAAAPNTTDPNQRLIEGFEMLALLPEIESAKEAGNTAALCPLYVKLIDIIALDDQRRLDRWTRLEPLLVSAAAAAGVDLSR